MARKPESIEGAVLRAVWTIHDTTGEWPTVHAIAAHLELDADSVRSALLWQRGHRVLRMRQRRGKRVWMPWSES